MAPATALDWMNETDFALQPTPSDLMEFFGIPPSPPGDLDANIREKRKYWRKKQQKARADEMIAFADAVLQAIAEAEDALKRGATATGGENQYEPGSTDGAAATIDDVWRELERLLFRSRYSDALDRVRQYQARWGDYPAFIDMRAVVILESAQNAPDITLDHGMVDSAIAGTRQVLQQIGPSEARYLTLVELLEVAGRAAEVPGVFAEANQRLTKVSASFRVRELAIRFMTEQWPVLLRHCVGLVRDSGDDRALRSELVQMIIGRVTRELLPLSSADSVTQYQMVVATAAWIADGVPEAEDFVRLHRMWASNADQPIFGGNWQWRAFFGMITLFLALPLINSSTAVPAWQVLLKGPATGDQKQRKGAMLSQNRTWFMVTRNAYVQPVHAACKLPWQNQPNEWPELDASRLFNF
jgi:hypothetical protein